MNRKLNSLGFTQLGLAKSGRDVTDVVPLEVMRDDTAFWEYMCRSNETLGEWQVMGLAKIVAFARDTTLHEVRQREIKEECLKYWRVPNETRKAPPMEIPQVLLQLCVLNYCQVSTYMNQLLLVSSPNLPRRISAIFH